MLAKLRASLLEDAPAGDIRRVWIPKGGGGQRGLGIPNVIDRVVQEAVRRVLEPVYEPTFHSSSHGFRPNRGCQTAITEARSYVQEGYEWVVDLDLEKFFDRVCHQRLLSRLAQRVEDKQLLVLIGRMLKAKVVMPDGVRVSTEEGFPKGARSRRCCPTWCWTSSITSSPDAGTGSSATQTTATSTCGVNVQARGLLELEPVH
ncbi:MAG: reverse transcriptase domain-containing protein [Planctomycetota bacterium]